MTTLTPAQFAPLQQARQILTQQETDARVAEHQNLQAETALIAARRSGEAQAIQQALNNHQAAQAAVETAHTQLKQTEVDIEQAYGTVLAQMDADDPLTALTGDCPIALFPVRLETRFIVESGRRELRVRIFPEELHVDTHEEALTNEELTWGQAYLERTADANEERDKAVAWAELADRFGAPRAAWIVRSLTQETTPSQRASSWTRAPYTELMPDRWLIVGYDEKRDQQVRVNAIEQFRTLGNPIPFRLKTGWDPQATEPDLSSEQVLTDDAMRWMVDFDEAERVGMAVRIDLTDYADDSIPFLIAVGVKATAGDATDILNQQFEALRYTSTLGFIPQGTPTNNTETVTSGYSLKDPLHQTQFTLEQLRGEAPDNSNAARMSQAFGVERAIFSHVWGGHADDQRGTSAMNRVLWPATWGYFLDRMLPSTALGPDHLQPTNRILNDHRPAVYSLFKDYVRARGPLPTLRVGNQPYGILPLVNLERWQPIDESETLDNNIRAVLQKVRDNYLGRQHSSIQQVGLGSRPERTLISLLSQSPVPMTFGVHHLMSDQFVDVVSELHQEWHHTPILNEAWERLREVFLTLGAGPLNLQTTSGSARPLVARSVYGNGVHTLDMPAVQAEALSATETLINNYLEDIQISSLMDLRNVDLANGPKALLYYLVRHAKLSAYARAIQKEQAPNSFTYEENELYNITTDDDTTCWDQAATPYPGTSRSYADQYDHLATTDTHIDPDLIDFDAGLEELKTLPTEDLDLLFRETLALTDYRVDAWATGFATKRLNTLRTSGHGGTYVGGYGWLYNLKVPPLETPTPANPTANDSVGYIQAPSIDQAKTAALLRSGQQARANEDESNPFNIDLSSERVHLARQLLDGVRAGQSLGMLLGYRFERRLQEQQLAETIPSFRNAYPIVAGKAQEETEPTDQPADKLAAPTVVDGLALIRALRRHTDLPAGTPHWIPSEVRSILSTGKLTTLKSVGHEVERALDAVGDAVITESTFQTLRGNPARAGAALDAIANGETPPPELESQLTPRQGRTISHRLFIPLQQIAPSSQRPRAQAAPQLNAFCTHVLGDLSQYQVTGQYQDVNGDEVAQRSLTIDTLELDAIDLVYLAATDPGGQSDLEVLLRDQFLSDRPDTVSPDASVHLQLDLADANQLDLATLLEHARALYQVIASSRPLTDNDLIEVGDEPAVTWAVTELSHRVEEAIASFTNALGTLSARLTETTSQPAQLRNALYGVSAFGIPGSIPLASADVPDASAMLTEQAQAVVEIMQTRQVQLQVLDATFGDAITTDAERIKFHTQQLKQVFGETFQILTLFSPANGNEIAAGFVANDTLLNGAQEAPEQLISQVAAVRPAVAQLQQLRDYTEILIPEQLALTVAQLPFADDSTRWAGLPGVPAEHGAISLLALTTTPYDPAQPMTGLFIDTWDELIPADTQTTGLAFNFNAPNSEPPNAILLATPADPTQPWSTDELLENVKTLVETLPFRAAQFKLPGLGHFLPAAFFAFNPENDTVSTDFSAYLD
ncbi:hypothetical protein Lepto7375DRAFT_1469 [Leptolyngbya sp. PCC 7375]|nr:hypothetical protein Lepto7375DRAFT_1469 [Leptolyngbya sp. PCC 7375]